jgi:hypothetical protein
VNIGLLVLLLLIWPGIEQVFPNLKAPEEIRYLLIAAVAGALGAMVVTITSFADYVGNRALVRSGGWWYVVRPFIGMTLGVLVYFCIRGGILKAGSDLANLNPYSIAGLSGLAGCFRGKSWTGCEKLPKNSFKLLGSHQSWI